MSESESPQRRRKSGNDQQPVPPGLEEGQGTDPAPESHAAYNPWLSPTEEPPQRRSARMEDILRRPGSTFPDRFGGNALWLIGALGLVSAWLLSTAIHVLGPDDRGIVTTLGRHAGMIGPGTTLTLPWPIQRVVIQETGKEQVLLMPDKEAETLMLTRDGELIDVRALVRWSVSDLKAFTYATIDGEAALRRLADSTLRAAVAELSFDELRSGKRQAEVQQRAAGQLQRVLDAWHTGIKVGGIELTATNPPARLAETFKKIDQASEDARKNHEAAIAYAARIRYSADTESAAFDKAFEQYRIAPAVTRERIYYETVERVLRNNPVQIGGSGPAIAAPPSDKAQAAQEGQ